MDKSVKSIFDGIERDIDNYKDSVTGLMQAYRSNIETAKREAAKYKDEDAIFAAKKERCAAAAYSEIERADKSLVRSVKQRVEKLRTELASYVCEEPSLGFMRQLEWYRSFNIKVTLSEIKSLLVRAGGNYLSLKALQSLAETAGYTVIVPDAQVFEDDIESIEGVMLAPLRWVDIEHMHEALEIFPNMPQFRADGTPVDLGYKPDFTSVLMRSSSLDELHKKIDAMQDRWTTDFVPKISELEPIKMENEETGETVTISPEEQHEAAVQKAADAVTVEKQDNSLEIAARMGDERFNTRSAKKKEGK